MSPVSHQTVRLARGRHTSPDKGACIMELASMLSHERFTDAPRAVCPVIGAFLRPLNDGLEDDARQQLYPLAARVVGTSGDRSARRARRALCRERHLELRRAGRSRTDRLFLWLLGNGTAGSCAAAFLNHATPEEAIAFVDELIAAGAPADPGRAPAVIPDAIAH